MTKLTFLSLDTKGGLEVGLGGGTESGRYCQTDCFKIMRLNLGILPQQRLYSVIENVVILFWWLRHGQNGSIIFQLPKLVTGHDKYIRNILLLNENTGGWGVGVGVGVGWVVVDGVSSPLSFMITPAKQMFRGKYPNTEDMSEWEKKSVYISLDRPIKRLYTIKDQ